MEQWTMQAQNTRAALLAVVDPAEKPVRYMRRIEASYYLNNTWGIVRAPQTLAKYAVEGRGPKFVKVGTVPMYRPEWLDSWARQLISDASEAA
jgi:hypothetical protein